MGESGLGVKVSDARTCIFSHFDRKTQLMLYLTLTTQGEYSRLVPYICERSCSPVLCCHKIILLVLSTVGLSTVLYFSSTEGTQLREYPDAS